MKAWTRSSFCLATLALAAASARAQPVPADPERRPYVQFEIDKNAADLVKKRLQLEKDLGPFKEIIHQVLNNPKGVNADLLKKLGDANVQDEQFKRSVQEMLKNDPKLKNDLQEWIEKTMAGKSRDDVAQPLKDLKQMLKESGKEPSGAAPVEPKPDQELKPSAGTTEPIRKSIENAMKKAENSDLGDWLKNSPAWQQAFRDLRNSMTDPQAANWKPGDWAEKLFAPNGKPWKLGAEALARLKDLPRPGLDRWTEKVALPGLGKIPTPSLGPPAMPTFNPPSMPSLNAGALWLLLAALCVLIGWRLVRWSKATGTSVDWRTSLGPWPVQPAAVTTRNDLVQAFDYLALLTLGHDAKSWSHKAIARRWCADAPAHAALANALAGLYEQARYTDGSPQLTPAQRDRARQWLRQLAEAR